MNLERLMFPRRPLAAGCALLMTAVAGVGATPGMASADELSFTSEQGDSIGQGQVQALPYANGALGLIRNVPGGRETLSFGNPSGTSPTFNLSFKAISGNLEVGCYERAQRAAFADAGRPGVDLGFAGRGCNDVAGRFRVLEIVRDMAGVPTSFAADFVQHCGETSGDALFGSVRYNSAIPTSPAMSPAFEITGRLDFTAAAGAIGSAGQGMVTRGIPFTRRTLDASRNFDEGMAFDYDGPVTGFPNNVSWSLDIAGANNAPIAPGGYPNATRFPFQAASEPGFAFSFNSSGCNTLVASFSAAAASYDALDGVPSRLSMMFDQRCPSASGPLTSGTLEFTATRYAPLNVPDLVHRGGFEDNEPGNSLFRACSN